MYDLNINDFTPLWGVWHLDADGPDGGLIGSGMFGKVYRMLRVDGDKTYYSAVRQISIKQHDPQILKDTLDCINRMYELRGHNNIVTYREHMSTENADGSGYEVFIRMECIKSLDVYTKGRMLHENEVVDMAIDICSALEAMNDTVHHNVKPSNIFVTRNGVFKLGDLMMTDNMMRASAKPKKSQLFFAAPEACVDGAYNNTSDIYSLGLVMYWLLNSKHAPFTDDDSKTALLRRLKGEAFPSPVNASSDIAKIILKACAFDPNERYQSPTEMKKALMEYSEYTTEIPAVTQFDTDNDDEKSEKKAALLKKIAIFVSAVIIIAAAAIALIWGITANRQVNNQTDIDNTTTDESSGQVSQSETEPQTEAITSESVTETSVDITPPVKDNTITSIVLNMLEYTMESGKTVSLKASIYPADAEDTSLVWSSSDMSVAMVDENGVVTALNSGKTIITATAVNGRTATCRITVEGTDSSVTDAPPEDTEITNGKAPEAVDIVPESILLAVGYSDTVSIKVLPEDAADRSYILSSADESIAAIINGNRVVAKKAGKTVITATTANGLTDTCEVNVKYADVKSIEFADSEITLKAGESQTISLIYTPRNPSDRTVKLESANTDIVSVEGMTINAVGEGMTTVTAVSANGKSAACTVIVTAIEVNDNTAASEETTIPSESAAELEQPADISYIDEPSVIEADSLTVSPSSLTLYLGKSSSITAEISPWNVTNKLLSIESGNTNVVMVDGLTVYAVGIGSAEVRVSTANGLTAACMVTVKDPNNILPEALSITPTVLNMTTGDERNIVANISPRDAANKTLYATSSNTNVAIVDKLNVKAVGEGTAVITVSTANGITAMCTVTVKDIVPKAIALTPDTITLKLGETASLKYKITPANSTDKTVVLTSALPDVVGVDGMNIYAVMPGTSLITGTTVNGMTDEVVVYVEEQPVTDFIYSIRDSKITITGYTGNRTTVVIPQYIDEYEVAAIDQKVFKDMDIKYVYIPTSIQAIGNEAFEGCSDLLIYAKDRSFAVDFAKLNSIRYKLVK